MVQDAMGAHLDRKCQEVAARMLDGSGSTMEKGFLLWHSALHEPRCTSIP